VNADFEGEDLVLRGPRLDLHTVLPHEYELLAVDRSDPRLWRDRGFANPAGHLVDDPGPLPFRQPRVEADPLAAPYLLRLAVLRTQAVIVGSIGFHMRPDDAGMIEVGLGVEPAYRGRGYAKEMLATMWEWVTRQSGVVTLRYTVSPDNGPSQAIIRSLGFTHVGVQQDEIDGPEDIFDMSAAEYRERFVVSPLA
jgi:ribosomal-protein-alanine N-acetyltransferase